MKIQKYFIYIKIIIIILILICSCGKEKRELTKNNDTSRTILLKIGNYNLTEEQFRRRIEKNKLLRHYNSIDNIKAIREAWDISLKIGLTLAESYQIGLDRDSLVVMSYEEARKKVLKNYVQMIPEDIIQSVNDKLIKESWKRRNRIYRIGYIFIKGDNQDIINVILKKLDNEVNVKKLSKSAEIIELMEWGEGKIELKDITGGDMPPVIERKVWKMNIGEYKVFKSKTGHHIVIVEGIRRRTRMPLSLVKKHIQKSIARALVNEKENSDLYEIKKNEIWIDEKKLAYLNYFNDTTETKTQLSGKKRIVIRLKRGDTITIEDLNLSMSRLSQDDRRFFQDKNNRLVAIKNLTMRMPKLNDYFEQKMKESWMVEELIKQEVLKKIKPDGNKILNKSQETGVDINTAIGQILEEKQNEYLRTFIKQQNKNDNNIRKGLIDLAYTMGFNNKAIVKKKLIEYRQRKGEFCWASSIRTDILDEFVFIDNNLIKNMNLIAEDSTPIASWGKSRFTLGELKDALKRYPTSTIQNLQISNKLKKLALYKIIEERCPQVKLTSINVNEDMLNQFDPLLDIRSGDLSDVSSISNDEVIARYGNNTMKVGEFKKIIKSWPEEKINKFYQHRFSVYKSYLESLLWSGKAVELGLDQDERVKQECSDLKEWLMLERFYNKFICLSPVFVENEYLKEWLSRFVASEEAVKLSELTKELRKKYEIKVNKELMEKIGLQIDSAFVCF